MLYTQEKFQTDILGLVTKHNIPYMEAIVMLCTEKSVDVEDIMGLITPFLKDKLFVEGQRAGMLKREPSVLEHF